MADLMYMMNTLVDANGKILVDGLEEQVAPLTAEERALYKNIDFDPEDYRKDIGTNCCIQKGDKVGSTSRVGRRVVLRDGQTASGSTKHPLLRSHPLQFNESHAHILFTAVNYSCRTISSIC